MINDPVLLRLGENHFWLSLADSDVLLWAKGVALGYGLAVDLCEPDVSPLAIQGPKAEQVTAALLGEWVKDLPFFWFKETHLGEIPLVVARSGWSKQGGFELYLRDGRYGEELWERVAAVGQPYGIAPGTPSAIERIESGLLSYGNDMTLENNPFEVGLGKYCDLEQEADFIGKAALKRIKAEGITQKLVGIEILGEPLRSNVAHYWPISHQGQPIGKVTSGIYSPRLEKNIGLAMLKLPYTAIGTPFEIESPQGTLSGVVSDTPKI
jgi:aminomethyltransferase